MLTYARPKNVFRSRNDYVPLRVDGDGFYSLEDEVTLQYHASDTGLGAFLLQLQQPVSFASRARAQTETSYAQIEEESLAIVFACETFDKYNFWAWCCELRDWS